MSPLNSANNQLVTRQGDQKLPTLILPVAKCYFTRGLGVARLLYWD